MRWKDYRDWQLDKLERRYLSYFTVTPCIGLEKIRKTMKSLSQDRWDSKYSASGILSPKHYHNINLLGHSCSNVIDGLFGTHSEGGRGLCLKLGL
jgi:hypothetical protein